MIEHIKYLTRKEYIRQNRYIHVHIFEVLLEFKTQNFQSHKSLNINVKRKKFAFA